MLLFYGHLCVYGKLRDPATSESNKAPTIRKDPSDMTPPNFETKCY